MQVLTCLPALAISTLVLLSSAAALAQDTIKRVAACGECHGAEGQPRGPHSPLLAGQPKTFLENQMIMIREGLREIPIKKGVFDGISDTEIISIARHFSAQEAKPLMQPRDPVLFARGQTAAKDLLCGTCHLPNYHGRDQMPRLAGQREAYLFETMKKFKNNQASGRDTIMAASLYGVAEEDLRAMAHYFSQLGL